LFAYYYLVPPIVNVAQRDIALVHLGKAILLHCSLLYTPLLQHGQPASFTKQRNAICYAVQSKLDAADVARWNEPTQSTLERQR